MSGSENKPSQLSQAIISYLASSSVSVRPSKTSPRQNFPAGRFPTSRLFGIPLHSLRPSQRVQGVPEFLVDACECLRPHLHTEGLFRKCGSTTRIKALKARLEAGERCLHMALPCDVATLVKEFLRSLPEPLIPAELQGSLCQAQQQSREERDSLVLLTTCLLPPRNAGVLRYFLSFLKEVVARCAQNKMDLANLAIIFVPNLFSGEMPSQMGISKAEERLRGQMAVTQVLISHASEIGAIPEPLWGKIHAVISDMETKRQFLPGQEETEDGQATGRRRRRRSVSYMVTEALSKFKTCRTLCVSPDLEVKQESQGSPVLKISLSSKRKASEEVVTVTEVSIKKRRSDLGLTSLDPADGNDGDTLERPDDITSVQGGAEPPTGKVQRKQSSNRKRPRRRSTTPAPNSFSPSFTERKQIGHKPLSIFSRNSKDQPPSPAAKGADPGGWFPLKTRREEAGDLAMVLPQGACLQSRQVQEDPRGSPCCSPRDEASAGDSVNPRALEDVKSRRAAEPTACFEELNSRQDAGPPLGRRGLLAKVLAKTSRQGLALTMCHKGLRRSLSWPEKLSLRDATDETNSSPDEAPPSPGGQEGLGQAAPTQPGMQEVVSGMKQLTLHMAPRAAPPGSPRAGSSGDESCHPSPKLFPSQSETSEARRVSQTPAGQLPPNSRRAALQPNEEPRLSILRSPEPKTRRRFGRSVSHESALPLQGEVSKGGESRQCPQTPLQQLKAYGRQIFLTQKHIKSSLAGLWGRKEGCGPPGDPPGQPASLLLEDHRVPQSCRSPRNPAREL